MSRPRATVTVGDQITTLLTAFTLTTAARELVSRFVEADQQPALPVLGRAIPAMRRAESPPPSARTIRRSCTPATRWPPATACACQTPSAR